MTTVDLQDIESDLNASAQAAAEVAGAWYEQMYARLEDDIEISAWVYAERTDAGLRVWQMIGHPVPPSLNEVSSAEEWAVQARKVAALNWAIYEQSEELVEIPDLDEGLRRSEARRAEVLAALQASKPPLRPWPA